MEEEGNEGTAKTQVGAGVESISLIGFIVKTGEESDAYVVLSFEAVQTEP